MMNTESPQLTITPGEWYASDMLATMSTDVRQMMEIPDVIGAMKDCRTVWGFPQIDSAAVDCGAVELDDLIFRRTSFLQDEFSAWRDGDYMKDCRTVWGFPQIDSAAVDCGVVELDDLIFHRKSFPPDEFSAGLVCSCFCSTVLSLRWLESADVPQGRHCRTTVGRSMPDICSLRRTLCIEGYLRMPCFCDSDNLLLLRNLQNSGHGVSRIGRWRTGGSFLRSVGSLARNVFGTCVGH